MNRIKFSYREKDTMCRRFGISLSQLRDALVQIGPIALNPNLQKQWTSDNPCSCFCYRVSEAVLRAGLVPENLALMRKKDIDGSHYFFKDIITGEIIDLTADQFKDGYDYDGAARGSLFPKISNGARKVAAAMGWEIPDSL